MNNPRETFDIRQILEMLPHRYPFLLVDRVLEYVPNKRVVAVKNVTVNEPFFVGHFPVRPVMPGVLILEAMAQACSLLIYKSRSVPSTTLYYLVRVDKTKFRRPVIPGDQLVLMASPKRSIHNVGCFETRAEVDGKLAAEAEIWCAAKELSKD